ncbi:hypothetical protein C8N29_1484 [Agitococcus lubricus]|uniref:Uncharacterized protein n=2 Tax=Agitococcus lubricus TaxID=1077255 RepID=A0A2T5IQ02_9GAMM|nr:hypothetical protein C8N29_1484 [Agitococcus lubricus]
MGENKVIVFGTITTDTELDSNRFAMNFTPIKPKDSFVEKIGSTALKNIRDINNRSFAIVGGHCIECKSKTPIFFDNGKPVYLFTITLPASKYIVRSNYETYSVSAWVNFLSEQLKEIDLKKGEIVYLGNGYFTKSMGKNFLGHSVPAGGTVTFKDMKQRDVKIFLEKFQAINHSEVSFSELNGSWHLRSDNR